MSTTTPPASNALSIPLALRPHYFNRGPAHVVAGYENLLFTGRRGLQAPELNEVQHHLHERIDGLAGALFADGNIVSGAAITNLEEDVDGNLQLGDGRIYLQGRVYSVPALKLTIPLDTTVAVGVRKITSVVTEIDDPTLLDPTQGYGDDFDNYQEPGAIRTKTVVHWGWQTSDDADDTVGDFFEVYTVENGVIIVKNIPPAVEAIIQSLAVYDRDAHGSYVTKGLTLRFNVELPPDGDSVNGYNTFNLREGNANIYGYKVGRTTGTRLKYPKNFDTRLSNNETSSNTVELDGTISVVTNRFPIASVGEIQASRVMDDAVVKGPANTTDVDVLSETSVSNVLRVYQGGTTYVEGDDYTVIGDDISWSPGGTEPATSSTYHVEYEYIVSLDGDTDPDVTVFPTHIDIVDLAPGTTVRVDYYYKLPRVDLITMDTNGEIHLLKGIAQPKNAAPPRPPLDHIALSIISYDWFNDPLVQNVSVKAVPFGDIERMGEQINDLYDLVAQERLKADMNSREPASKRGMFVDAFFDDDLRDQGITPQTAASADGSLVMGMSMQGKWGDNAVNLEKPWLLPYVLNVVVDQPKYTSCMKINPYQAFEPIPARVTLVPDVDRMVVHQTAWLSPIVQKFVPKQAVLTGGGQVVLVDKVTHRPVNATIRPITVQFTIEGFGAGETLDAVTFDDIPVVPIEVGLVGDSNGKVVGHFVIPVGVPVGAKPVDFAGGGGSQAEATFVGDALINTDILRRIRTVTGRRKRKKKRCDPLAQTFTLEDSRMVAGIRVKFCKVGDPTKPVYLQLRETVVGFPTEEVFSEAVFDMSTLTTDVNGVPPVEWTEILFDIPAVCLAGKEYAFVLMTDDAAHSVAIASLGKYAPSPLNGGAQGWVSRQPYQAGVLLASSNAVTWTPLQESDLTMQLLCCEFTASERIVTMGVIDGVDVSDIITQAGVVRPSVDTDITFRYTHLDSSTEWEDVEDVPMQLPAFYDGDMRMDVRLVNHDPGDHFLSPILYPQPQALFGTTETDSNYYGRTISTRLIDSIPTDFDAILVIEVKKTGSANVIPRVWTLVTGVPTYVDLPFLRSTPLADGFVEMEYRLDAVAHLTPDYLTRVFLQLTGTPLHRPIVRNLRFTVV